MYVIEFSRHDSVNAFAKHIGLKRAENIYQIKRGKNAISLHLANLITRHYPDIDKGWLLTGEGWPMKDQYKAPGIENVPLYQNLGNFLAGTHNGRYIPMVTILTGNAAFAVRFEGTYLVPFVKSGSLLFFEKCAHDIKAGDLYLVILRDKTYHLRFCKKASPERIILSTHDPELFEETVLNAGDIAEIFHAVLNIQKYWEKTSHLAGQVCPTA